jgi:UDP-2,4-diacetamido-2,4,6-trideoxy-beta-L-altropyranose hydrolase
LDDLANRNHRADVLVDQNLGRTADDYRHLVPPSCEVLTGSRYAMLRRDFLKYRESSLQRRTDGSLSSVLISFGGADSENVTGQVLGSIMDMGLHQSLGSLVVVLGAQSGWKEETAAMIAELGGRARLLCGVDNMAEVMSGSDLSIGGGGTTAWERCCLGLPSLLLSIADNQTSICESLDEAGAALYLGDARSPEWHRRFSEVLEDLIRYPDRLAAMSRRARAICDGLGADRLVGRIVEID